MIIYSLGHILISTKEERELRVPQSPQRHLSWWTPLGPASRISAASPQHLGTINI